MELAFINAILHSPNFPPHDPWLAGYAISYYYFGYILVAMLAMLTGTPGGVAFNLGISLVFALSALGAYSLVFNLLAARRPGSDGEAHRFSLRAIFGPVFILLVSNLVGFLEVLHARGIFWDRDAAGQLVSVFWKWLDLRELSQAPAEPYSWLPTRYLWWWRASRVVQDYDYAHNWKEVIDEFPVFLFHSFRLASACSGDAVCLSGDGVGAQPVPGRRAGCPERAAQAGQCAYVSLGCGGYSPGGVGVGMDGRPGDGPA
jgi:uncharacterized membrane protein